MAAITFPTTDRSGASGALAAVLTVLSAAFVASSTPGLAEAGVLTTARAQERPRPRADQR